MTTSLEIRFEEPAAPILRSDESIAAFVAALQARPGDWALFGSESSPGCAGQRAYEIRHALRGGGTRHFGPAGAFDATAKTVIGEHRVYVRYVGRAGVR